MDGDTRSSNSKQTSKNRPRSDEQHHRDRWKEKHDSWIQRDPRKALPSPIPFFSNLELRHQRETVETGASGLTTTYSGSGKRHFVGQTRLVGPRRFLERRHPSSIAKTGAATGGDACGSCADFPETREGIWTPASKPRRRHSLVLVVPGLRWRARRGCAQELSAEGLAKGVPPVCRRTASASVTDGSGDVVGLLAEARGDRAWASFCRCVERGGRHCPNGCLCLRVEGVLSLLTQLGHGTASPWQCWSKSAAAVGQRAAGGGRRVGSGNWKELSDWHLAV
ncbi:hypothetical protein Dimus_027935 [Dionaea muscipula]